jgi:hypothetical protein
VTKTKVDGQGRTVPDSSPPTVERFGPEWWTLYAAAWHVRWTPVRNGIGVQRADGGYERQSVDRSAIALMAIQDADEGIAAFNETVSR